MLGPMHPCTAALHLDFADEGTTLRKAKHPARGPRLGGGSPTEGMLVSARSWLSDGVLFCGGFRFHSGRPAHRSRNSAPAHPAGRNPSPGNAGLCYPGLSPGDSQWRPRWAQTQARCPSPKTSWACRWIFITLCCGVAVATAVGPGVDIMFLGDRMWAQFQLLWLASNQQAWRPGSGGSQGRGGRE